MLNSLKAHYVNEGQSTKLTLSVCVIFLCATVTIMCLSQSLSKLFCTNNEIHTKYQSKYVGKGPCAVKHKMELGDRDDQKYPCCCYAKLVSDGMVEQKQAN